MVSFHSGLHVHSQGINKDQGNEFKMILERCHDFLMEELEPEYFLRDKKMADIFKEITEDIRASKSRKDKNKLLLKYLKEQPEETIKSVLENLGKKSYFIQKQLFPNTTALKEAGKFVRLWFYVPLERPLPVKGLNLRDVCNFVYYTHSLSSIH